jgi:hypothetical protein
MTRPSGALPLDPAGGGTDADIACDFDDSDR